MGGEKAAPEGRQINSPGRKPWDVSAKTDEPCKVDTYAVTNCGCVAPQGLSSIRNSNPKAYAQGYPLSPLRGY
jgi:hypothetical protein